MGNIRVSMPVNNHFKVTSERGSCCQDSLLEAKLNPSTKTLGNDFDWR
jgi:hypothetical protein